MPFGIDAWDMLLYARIGVPPPTWCPECRLIRRMSWRNERALYKRTCGAPGHTEDVISIFSSDKPFVVYDQKYWWSDAWDSLAFGAEYDFSKPFFLQFRELLERVPQIALFNSNAVCTEYANHALDSKDSFLISASYKSDHVMYANRVLETRDSADLYLVGGLEGSYEAVNCGTSYKLRWCYGCEDSQDLLFSYDCRNCSQCIGCVGLRNKQYYIFNNAHTKEAYQEFARKLDTGSYRAVEELKKTYLEHAATFPRKYMYSLKTVDVTGDILVEAKNCASCFDAINLEDCKYVVWGGFGMKDSMDGYGIGEQSELLYESVDAGISGSRMLGAIVVYGGHDIRYAYNCHGSSNVFGCTGLRSKSYCILNKQYSKEDYEALLPKIIQHINDMPYTDKKGREYRYGEFFPAELCPFAYNETIAQEYFPVTRETAADEGYAWKDADARSLSITVPSDTLPDNIADAADDLAKEVVGCAHAGECNEQCTTGFRIVPQELAFYREMRLPLPRLCPNCRHYRRVKQRNPLRLWHRLCTCAGTRDEKNIYQNTTEHFHGTKHCSNKFETSYASDRPEIVYCESCYNSEVV